MVIRVAGEPVKEEEKTRHDVEVSKEVFEKLEALIEEEKCLDIKNELDLLRSSIPYYQKRREFLKTIPKFWPAALMRYGGIALYAQHDIDQKALGYLEDVWVERDPKEVRLFTIEFHFAENEFFSDKVIKKVYKFAAKEVNAEDEKPLYYGVTRRVLEFNWIEDVEIEASKISWKKDITKEFPRVIEEEDIADPGSFFNFFTHDDDPFDIGVQLANDFWPKAIEFATGSVSDEEEIDSEDDEESESEEDDDDDEAEEIDLEAPKKKKRRV